MATTQDIVIDGGRTLRVVHGEVGDKTPALATALGIEGVFAVIVLAGAEIDADERLQARLVQLLGRGLVRAAREAGALCVVRGGATGLAGRVGRLVADLDRPPPLLGVAPADALVLPGTAPDAGGKRQPPMPGLSHLLLTPGDAWGAELKTTIELAQVLATDKPALMVLVGGDANAPAEVLQAVRRRWPVLLVKGTGGAADALARQWAARAADHDDPVVAEILADGHLTCITLGDKVGEAVESLARQVLRQSGGESVLRQAWRRFAAIDAAANAQQANFMQTQWRILALGVLAVFLAIVYSQLTGKWPLDTTKSLFDALGAAWEKGGFEFLRTLVVSVLHYVLIIVPIGTSMLIAATNRFKPGKRWVLLRSAAENIKREIYRFRLHAVDYETDATRETELSKAIEDITRRLARTEANTTALPQYTGVIPPQNAASPRDDGMSQLSTDQYVRVRLEDQLSFYRRKTVQLEKELQRLQWWVLAAGAIGTLLAAIGGLAVIWITLTTALGAAFMTYLSYRQVETTLVGYNQTATDLDNILSWWTALEPEEQAQRSNIEALASHTEQVLADELAGWTQRMTDALEKLRDAQLKEQEERKERGKAGNVDGPSEGGDGADSTPAPERSADPADGAPPLNGDAPAPEAPAGSPVDPQADASTGAQTDLPTSAPVEAPAAPPAVDPAAPPAVDPAELPPSPAADGSGPVRP